MAPRAQAPGPRANPFPNFNFLVELGDGPEFGFSEIILPKAEVAVIEYREGADRESASRKIPGRVSLSDVVLKRGIGVSLVLVEWWNQVVQGNVQRRDVVIKLLDETRNPVRIWKLRSAFPSKIEFAPLNAKGNEIAIEELHLAYEELNIE